MGGCSPCSRCEELLLDVVDGHAAEADVQLVREHTLQCSACAEQLDALRVVGGALQTLPRYQTPAGFAQSVIANLDAPVLSGPTSWRAPLAMVATLLLGATIAFYGSWGQRSTTQPSETGTSVAVVPEQPRPTRPGQVSEPAAVLEPAVAITKQAASRAVPKDAPVVVAQVADPDARDTAASQVVAKSAPAIEPTAQVVPAEVSTELAQAAKAASLARKRAEDETRRAEKRALDHMMQEQAIAIARAAAELRRAQEQHVAKGPAEPISPKDASGASEPVRAADGPVQPDQPVPMQGVAGAVQGAVRVHLVAENMAQAQAKLAQVLGAHGATTLRVLSHEDPRSPQPTVAFIEAERLEAFLAKLGAVTDVAGWRIVATHVSEEQTSPILVVVFLEATASSSDR